MWAKKGQPFRFLATATFHDPKMNPVPARSYVQPTVISHTLSKRTHNNTVILKPPLSEFVLNSHLEEKKSY